MRVLITGGLGYIGSHAVKLFLKNKHDVIIFDNNSRGNIEVLDILKKYGNLTYIEGDLVNQEAIEKVFEENSIDAVVHFAGYALVNESVEDPQLYYRNNVVATHNLLCAMQKSSVDKLIFSSSCVTYGESEYMPVDEKHPQIPTHPYGNTKLIAEKEIMDFSNAYGMKYVIFRYFNVTGADSEGEIGDASKPSMRLVQNVVRGALGIEEFLLCAPKVDTPDGTPIRDYVDVEDLVRSHLMAVEFLENGNDSNIFNIGTGSGYSIKEVIETSEMLFDVNIPQKPTTPRKGDPAKVYADITKVKNILGWEPQKSLKDSLKSLEKWYKSHPNGY